MGREAFLQALRGGDLSFNPAVALGAEAAKTGGLLQPGPRLTPQVLSEAFSGALMRDVRMPRGRSKRGFRGLVAELPNLKDKDKHRDADIFTPPFSYRGKSRAGRHQYVDECRKGQVLPLPVLVRKRRDGSVDLRNYGMGDKLCSAFAKSLKADLSEVTD